MDDHRKELFDDTCWVYVRREETGEYTVGITYEETFRRREHDAGSRLLLWRKFEDTFSAAGYRILLKKLTDDQLRKIIATYNCEDDYQNEKLNI